jgi:muramoyltetrapeptide carboxypeptidase
VPLVLPAALRPGDTVAVIAPSGPLPRDAFFAGLAWLRDRYTLRVASSIVSRAGYLAGDDARRGGELAAALADPAVKAIVAGRGGYGAMRLLGGDGSPIARLGTAPRWVVGFSDITALHVEAGRAGVASVHGPNVTGLAHASGADRAAWLTALERPGAAVRWEGLSTVHDGSGPARGAAFGGNLALLEAMAAAGRLDVPRGAVLFLEDTDERPYRVDRMLTSLALGGHLRRASAIVLGGFTRCNTGLDGVTVDEVLADRTAGLGVRVVTGAPFGHGEENRAFILGREVIVDGGAVEFPAVAGAAR